MMQSNESGPNFAQLFVKCCYSLVAPHVLQLRPNRNQQGHIGPATVSAFSYAIPAPLQESVDSNTMWASKSRAGGHARCPCCRVRVYAAGTLRMLPSVPAPRREPNFLTVAVRLWNTSSPDSLVDPIPPSLPLSLLACFCIPRAQKVSL